LRPGRSPSSSGVGEKEGRVQVSALHPEQKRKSSLNMSWWGRSEKKCRARGGGTGVFGGKKHILGAFLDSWGGGGGTNCWPPGHNRGERKRKTKTHRREPKNEKSKKIQEEALKKE